MDQTAHEERMYEHYKRIEDENYHLKKQLYRANKNTRYWKKKYFNLERKYKKVTDNQKPRYRNNGKGGK